MDTTFSEKLFDFYRNVYVTMEKLCNTVLETENISMIQLRLLLVICGHGEIPVGQLSQSVGMNSGNCSSMCKKMEQLGLIERRRGKEDERIVTLVLTPEGQETARRIFGRIFDYHEDVCRHMSQEEIETITQSMDIVSGYLNRLG